MPASPNVRIFDVPGVDIRNECPLVMIRTSGWFGGFQIYNWEGPATGRIQFQSTAQVEFAIFSVNAPISGSNTGMQIFDAAGRIAFHSDDRVPRIFSVPSMDGSNVQGSVGFTNVGAQPWICANQITSSLSVPMGSGSDASYPPYILAVAYSAASIQYRMPENGGISSSLNAPANKANLNPYYGRSFSIPVGIIPGY